MSVLVVDYGMGNLGSVRRSLEECGAEVRVSDDPEALAEASRIVLPGVGSFADGMASLHARGWQDALREAVYARAVPLLGICLGMQLLAERGQEGGEQAGLGFVPGEVCALEPDAPGVRIPHVGWNEVVPRAEHPIFRGIAPGSDFYFVHSFHFVPADAADVLGVTPYCGEFVSAVGRANVLGVQFHPEKSSISGRRLLGNFLG